MSLKTTVVYMKTMISLLFIKTAVTYKTQQ